MTGTLLGSDLRGFGRSRFSEARRAPDRKAGILKTPLRRWVQLGTREGWIITLRRIACPQGGHQASMLHLSTRDASIGSPAGHAPHMVEQASNIAGTQIPNPNPNTMPVDRRHAQVWEQRA